MSWIEEFAVTVVIGILNQVIKSPKAKAGYRAVLVHIQQDATEAIQAIDAAGGAPTTTGD